MQTPKQQCAVLISGNGSNLQAIIDQVHLNDDNPGEIACVISNKADAFGLQRAAQASIPHHVIEHQAYPNREAFEAAMIDQLRDYSIDWIVLAGFMRILSPTFIHYYLGKMINIHPSLLPKYPGLNTHNQVFNNKDTHHGCSVHLVTEDLDAGPIIGQASFKIDWPTLDNNDQGDQEKVNALQQSVHKLEHRLYPAVLNQLFFRDKDTHADQVYVGIHE